MKQTALKQLQKCVDIISKQIKKIEMIKKAVQQGDKINKRGRKPKNS